jgi:ArsR family transcriptional regulator
VIVIDYAPHQDERLRAEQADHWLGFDRGELAELARRAGLRDATVTPIPGARCGAGPDGHLPWQVLAARVPDREER